MANDEHVALLKRGVAAWNEWRYNNPNVRPDLRKANLDQANLSGANLNEADLYEASLSGANLSGVELFGARLTFANLFAANLSKAKLERTMLPHADLRSADLSCADAEKANLSGANLSGANLTAVDLSRADLLLANLSGANLSRAILVKANLDQANLSGANLKEANLQGSILINADLTGADLTGCLIFGVSAWELKHDETTKQQDLIITPKWDRGPRIAVDNIEVAQFIYLLLHNEKIRDVIDTIGKKGVLLLGRFTEGRIAVLERLREELRARGYLPIVFNFEKPETKDFTETVRLLAALARFVIADVTNPKSAPLELQATVPEIMVPFFPIIEEGEEPFAMLVDLWIKHRDWVFEPLYYSSLDALMGALDQEIIKPAEVRFDELVVRKAETMKGKHV